MSYVTRIHKIIKKHFIYLVDEFNYKIIEESSFLMGIYVKYCSCNCEVFIYTEGGHAGVVINPLIDIPGIANGRDKKFELFHVLNFVNPELHFSNKESMLLSRELKRMSYYLLAYCKKIIKGDFSIWPEMDKYWSKKGAELIDIRKKIDP